MRGRVEIISTLWHLATIVPVSVAKRCELKTACFQAQFAEEAAAKLAGHRIGDGFLISAAHFRCSTLIAVIGPWR